MRATLEEEGGGVWALFLCNETEVRDSMQTEFDTVVISTAPGEGAIVGIVRISEMMRFDDEVYRLKDND